jgi:hypothetical protein
MAELPVYRNRQRGGIGFFIGRVHAFLVKMAIKFAIEISMVLAVNARCS